jgi:hypothetical protein
MPTICILYGFCEGPRVSKRFRQALARAGYTVIKDPAQADIIIGHSGGCFSLPKQLRAKQIIQIGIVHWPGRSVLGSLIHKLKADVRHHHREGAIRFWARKSFWNFVYFWNFVNLFRMLIGRRRGRQWGYGQITTVVRPKLDSFCTPDLDLLPFAKKPKFVELPGQHDECWRKPDSYLALLKY